MSDRDAIREGGCRCGQVRFRIAAPAILTMACHCKGCQRMTGSAYSLSEASPSQGFSITSGEPVIGGLHGASRHYFCRHCMSWLFTRPDGVDAFVTIRPTMLDDSTSFKPFIETWTSQKLRWATTTAARGFAALPAPEEYQGLAEDYACETESSSTSRTS